MRILSLIESALLTEAYRISRPDMRVIDAFVARREEGGKLLTTDGRRLNMHGIGGEELARWRGRHIVITSTEATRPMQTILRRVRRQAAPGVVKTMYDDTPALRFEFDYDVHGGYSTGYQVNGKLLAFVPGRSEPVGKLFWSVWRKRYTIEYAEVVPEYRRTGVATEMYRAMFKKEGITAKDLGPSFKSADGAAFRRGAHF